MVEFVFEDFYFVIFLVPLNGRNFVFGITNSFHVNGNIFDA